MFDGILCLVCSMVDVKHRLRDERGTYRERGKREGERDIERQTYRCEGGHEDEH